MSFRGETWSCPACESRSFLGRNLCANCGETAPATVVARRIEKGFQTPEDEEDLIIAAALQRAKGFIAADDEEDLILAALRRANNGGAIFRDNEHQPPKERLSEEQDKAIIGAASLLEIKGANEIETESSSALQREAGREVIIAEEAEKPLEEVIIDGAGVGKEAAKPLEEVIIDGAGVGKEAAKPLEEVIIDGTGVGNGREAAKLDEPESSESESEDEGDIIEGFGSEELVHAGDVDEIAPGHINVTHICFTSFHVAWEP